MTINELHMPDKFDKINVLDIYQTPYCFYYFSHRLLSVWIKKDRRKRYCLCAYGYNHKLHRDVKMFEQCKNYDVLFQSFNLEDTAREFVKFIKDELFMPMQGELNGLY